MPLNNFPSNSDLIHITDTAGNFESDNVEGALAQLGSNFKSTAENESATLGEELVDETGWNSDGWTGDFATGFTHTAGNTIPLTRTMVSTGAKYYHIEFDVSAALGTNELTVSIGGSDVYDLYVGSPTHITIGVQSASDGNLIFAPISGFNKTISNITVKEVISARLPTWLIKDSASAQSVEIRSCLATLNNIFIGAESGQYNISGNDNVGIGKSALKQNISGFWNVGVGYLSMRDNTAGSRNVALGSNTLTANKTGLRNNAFGSSALYRNTTGNNNIGFGCDALYYNTTGSSNVAIGFVALSTNADGSYNTAIGDCALRDNVSGSHNVAIGYSAMWRCTVSENVAVGKYACYGLTIGIENTAIGTGSLQRNVTGAGNVGIGYDAGYGAAGTSQSHNTIIGARAGLLIGTGANNNTLIGYKSGDSIVTGHDNILIGYDIDTPAADTSSYLNIGGAITGNLTTKMITMEKLTLSNLPTADPHVVGQLWNNSSVLTVSAG